MGQLTERELARLAAETTSDKVRRVWDGGDGLYAQVSPQGVISFWMKYRFREPGSERSKERADGIGRWGKDAAKGQITLSVARARAREIRVALHKGLDPRRIETKPEPAVKPMTFEEAAKQWLEVRGRGLSPSKLSGARRYVAACNEAFGTKRLDDVTPDDVSKVLHTFYEAGKHESAKRARICCGQVFKYAIAIKRTYINPAAALKDLNLLPKRRPAVVHHAAMAAKRIPAFLDALRANLTVHPSVRLGLQFTALTVMRTGEVIDLRWTDIAEDGKSLTIPAERMKAGRAHTVHLSRQARAVLDEIKPFSEGREYVFPGRDPNEPLSRMAMLMTLRRMDTGATVHGFRSSFSTWAHATRAASDAVIERCLAHAAGDQVAAAYNRHTYELEAAKLWQKWAEVVTSSHAKGNA